MSTSLPRQLNPEQHNRTDAEQAYPLPRPDADPRFSFGLLFDVAKTLESAGYPEVRGVDLITLQQALYRFLYAEGGTR